MPAYSKKGSNPRLPGSPLPQTGSLRWRIVVVLLVAALLPLAIVGIGAWLNFGRLLEQKSLELHRHVVQAHARSIDLYFNERLRALDLVARIHGAEELRNPATLKGTLTKLNDAYENAFVDLGVIGEDGTHLAYLGPFDLLGRNYSGEKWFREVMLRGDHISDVFLGFRGVPHCVIAVRRQEGTSSWVLRATINGDEFNALVQARKLGETGEAFILDSRGRYQTPPRTGFVLDPSPILRPQPHQGVLHGRVEHEGKILLRATSWLNHGQWMLVVQQDEAEIQGPVRRAMLLGALVVSVAILLVVMTTFVATWHLTGRIDDALRERDLLSENLIRSSKLASLGELSSGLAHEINNPLAIISAELTNIMDLVEEADGDIPAKEPIVKAVQGCKRQVRRCGNITSKILQFGRKTDTRLELADLRPRLEEVSALMKKQSQVKNAELSVEIEPDLPRLLLDSSELEQVLVNLINNSLQALNGGGEIRVVAKRAGDEVLIQVADTGAGIAPEHLDLVFNPFFTTKMPGEGTGLGLSVCYGIVKGWGGTIDVASEPGTGTIVTIRLPVPVPGSSNQGAAGGANER